MKTILIPTDFSNNAWRAAGYAANLYKDVPCRFILFHAYAETDSIVEVDIPHVIASKSEEVNMKLKKVKEEFQEFDHCPDSVIEATARYGLTSETIVNEAKNEFVDMIVMGTKGVTNDVIIAVGSSTLGVLESIPCSVICIPEKATIECPEHIMFATDYHNLGNLDRLVELKEIARSNTSKISIVNVKIYLEKHIRIEQDVEELVLDKFLGEIPHEYFDHQEDDVEMGILNFAHQKRVNLVVMINRSRSYWEDLFHKSLSESTAIHSDIPLLILKD